jgi:hypothetical protein
MTNGRTASLSRTLETSFSAGKCLSRSAVDAIQTACPVRTAAGPGSSAANAISPNGSAVRGTPSADNCRKADPSTSHNAALTAPAPRRGDLLHDHLGDAVDREILGQRRGDALQSAETGSDQLRPSPGGPLRFEQTNPLDCGRQPIPDHGEHVGVRRSEVPDGEAVGVKHAQHDFAAISGTATADSKPLSCSIGDANSAFDRSSTINGSRLASTRPAMPAPDRI